MLPSMLPMLSPVMDTLTSRVITDEMFLDIYGTPKHRTVSYRFFSSRTATYGFFTV